MTAHRCAGGLKKKLDLRSSSLRHRHFVGFFNVPVLAPTWDQPFYTVIFNDFILEIHKHMRKRNRLAILSKRVNTPDLWQRFTKPGVMYFGNLYCQGRNVYLSKKKRKKKEKAAIRDTYLQRNGGKQQNHSSKIFMNQFIPLLKLENVQYCNPAEISSFLNSYVCE